MGRSKAHIKKESIFSVKVSKEQKEELDALLTEIKESLNLTLGRHEVRISKSEIVVMAIKRGLVNLKRKDFGKRREHGEK